MDNNNIQQQLFTVIKNRVPDNVSVADETARVLEISADSAYRRIRGEKPLSLDELNTLCNHYKISLDQLMSIQSGGFVFQGQLIDGTRFRYETYVTGMLHQMAYFKSCREKELFYLCKDFPYFHYYHFREIATFKYFFWMKTFLNAPEFRDQKFRFDLMPDQIWEIGQNILSIYNEIPSYEVWNAESINNILRQVDYYWDCNLFESVDDAYRVCDCFEKFLEHMERQAAAGSKFSYNTPVQKKGASFEMYFNEVLSGDNNILVVLDGVKNTLISHNIFNYMSTTNTVFNEYMYEHIQNLMRRSTLISSVSEKERAHFFRLLREKVRRRKNALTSK